MPKKKQPETGHVFQEKTASGSGDVFKNKSQWLWSCPVVSLLITKMPKIPSCHSPG